MMGGWRRDFLSKEGDPEYSHQVIFFLITPGFLTVHHSPATRLCFDTTHDGFYKFKGPLWSFTGKEAGHGHFSDFKKGSPNGKGLV
jgi:hypothetical protein